MKIKFLLTAAGLACAGALGAAPLSVSTAVQSQPDPASPVIAVLAAGSEAPLPSQNGAAAPSGWTAVDVSGPFTGYVKNKDLTKQLDVEAGASIYLAPKEGSGVLAVFAKGDRAVITGLHGGWTQIRLEKTLVGYIATTPALPVAPSEPTAPSAPPSTPMTAPTAPAGALAPMPSGEKLSQLFEGTLAQTKSVFGPRRPFKWQLLDAAGKHIAYVDLSSLLLTDQIENYSGHAVVVLGSLKPVKETGDIVIVVEALHLK